MRIQNDKYYTPNDVVDFCLEELKKVLKQDDFVPTRVIEPSAGNGAFSKKIKNCIAYDIEPEDDNIIKADFLNLDIQYLQGTIVVGNPPFGAKLNLARQFYNKSIKIADYVAFILPISQLNNNRYLYQFDLIKSIDLGIQKYSNRELHCCFNIFRKPTSGEFNKKPSFKLKCVSIVRNDNKAFNKVDYDIRFCYWGNGSAGKILAENESSCAIYKIKIDEQFKERVINVLKNTDWKKELKFIAMKKISMDNIYLLLKKEIPDIY